MMNVQYSIIYTTRNPFATAECRRHVFTARQKVKTLFYSYSHAQLEQNRLETDMSRKAEILKYAFSRYI